MTQKVNIQEALTHIVATFSPSEDGGAIFLKYTLLPDNDESNEAIEHLYKEITNAFSNDKDVGEKIIESLKTIRYAALEDAEISKMIDAQIEQILQFKAMVHFAQGRPANDFLKEIVSNDARQ